MRRVLESDITKNIFASARTTQRSQQLSFFEARHSEDSAAASGTPSKADKFEAVAVIALLLLLSITQWCLALKLQRLGVFNQYDVFFDADPNQYVSAIADGSDYGRLIHPAFALFVNAPVRAFDFVAAATGMVSPGAVRRAATLIVSPLFSGLAGWLCWRAFCFAGFSRRARLAGLLLSQFCFSQTVFAALPESFALSGAGVAALLLLAVIAAQHPERLNTRSVQAQWLTLACWMTGITVTNGLLCITVWAAIRCKAGRVRRTVCEAAIAAVIAVGFCLGAVVADRMAFEPGTGNVSVAWKAAWWVDHFSHSASLAGFVELPASLFSALVAPRIHSVPNAGAQISDLYQYSFSVEPAKKSTAWIILGWLGLGALFAFWQKRSINATTGRAVSAVLIFNALLLTIFGSETFLYSQHWSAFLIFAFVLPFSKTKSQSLSTVFAFAVVAVVLCTLSAWSTMFAALNTTFNFAVR